MALSLPEFTAFFFLGQKLVLVSTGLQATQRAIEDEHHLVPRQSLMNSSNFR